MTRSHMASMEEEKTKGDNNENCSSETRETTNNEAGVAAEGKVDTGDVGKRKNRKRHKDRSKTDNQIPIVTVENPTPSPRPPTRSVEHKDKGEDGEEEDEDEDEDMEYETGEEEEVEEEEEETEMTQEEKLVMYTCVKEGDIDGLEDCLDLPNADINMIWFKENLLMAATRAGQTEMAEFLVDNGVDHTFTTSRLVLKETPDGKVKFDRFEVDCRQMAFDQELDDLVFLIDHLQGRLFSFVPGPKRSPRLRRPPPTTPTDSNTDGENSSDADISDSSSQESLDEEGNEKSMTEHNDADTRKRRRKKRKTKKQSETVLSDGEEDGEKDKTARTGSTFGEMDSGNYSMVSSHKLKKSIVEKHNELLEQDEKVSVENIKSARKSLSGGASEKSQVKSQQEQEDPHGNDNETEDKTGSSQITAPSSLSPEKKQQLAEAFHPPPKPIRLTRSALAVQRSNALRRFYTSPLNESNLDTPLQWRKIHTSGSYAMESKHWHHDNSGVSADSELSVSVEPLSTNTKIPSASTTSGKSSLLPTVSIRPSSPPRTTSSASSSSKSSPRSSISRLSSTSAKPTVSILKVSSSERPIQHISESPKHEKPVAGYMRHTQSTITKQRLQSSFVDSYGGLEFHHNPGRSQMFKTKRPYHSIKPTPISPVLTVSYHIPKKKSDLQRRNQNTISFRA